MIFCPPASLHGVLRAPASKSHVQRLLLAASLGEGASILHHPGHSEDALHCARVVSALGSTVKQEAERWIITPQTQKPLPDLHCGESGFCLRAASALAALSPECRVLHGAGSLTRRPMTMIEEPLRSLGVECSSQNGLPPLRVQGPYKSGRSILEGAESSQFLSGLLLALPKAEGVFELEVKRLRSVPYVQMTLDVLADFGVPIKADADLSRFCIQGGQRYCPVDMAVEGDWSAAAFLLAAGALAGEITVEGLSLDSSQADKAVITALEAAGVDLSISSDSITARQSAIRAFEFDATHCPDLFPPLAALACHGQGVSRIKGVERLRNKESNRALTLQQELGHLGARIELEDDWMLVYASKLTGGKLTGGEVDSHNDHRIAMACAVAGLRSKNGVQIHGEACVAKSYPDFFRDLESLVVRR